MIENARFVQVERVEQLFESLGVLEPSVCDLSKHICKLADASTTGLTRFVDFWFDDAVINRASDFDKHICKAFDSLWILFPQASGKFKFSFFLLEQTGSPTSYLTIATSLFLHLKVGFFRSRHALAGMSDLASLSVVKGS